MALFERADTGRPVTWLSILGLILVPVIIAAGFVFAAWQANDRLDSVRAAVVNNDEGAEVDGQTVPLGRQLSAGLVDSEEDNLEWVLSDDADAADGLASGEYAAVITIPEGFSRAVMSSGEDDPLLARQATIDVTSSQVSPLADATIGQAIAEVARTQFNTGFTSQYLDKIYLGFNDIGEQFREVADAAGEIADGTEQLSEGTGDAAEGATAFADGAEQLDAGSGPLVEGANGIADGAGGLATGARELSGGANELADGTEELAGGAGELADGADELSDGLGQMRDQTADLPDQTRQLADGASQLSEGVDEYTGGIDELVRQLGEFDTGGEDGSIEDLTDGLDELSDGSSQLADGIAGINDGLGEYQQGLDDQAAAAGNLAGSATSLDDLVAAGLMTESEAEAARAQLCPEGTAPEVCAGAEPAFVAGLLSGTAGALEGASAGLDQQDPRTGQSINSGLDELEDGASQLDDGVQELASGLGAALTGLVEGLAEFTDRSDELLDGSRQLREGASGLADGTDQLADGMGDLSDGIGASADGATQLADGTDQLADGTGELASGARQLADGTGQLADGADELSAGAGEFTTGLSAYTDGVGQLSTGAGDLATGLTELDEGTGELAEGTRQLADGLDEGKDQIPSYTAPERDALAEAVSEPVAADDGLLGSISQASTIALLLVMALWLGALITYTVVRAVSATAVTSRKPSWAIMARGLLPGLLVAIVQAVILTFVGQIVLELHFFDLTALLVLAMFAGIVFMVVNYALVAWFGGVGRFVSVALVVLAVAGRALGATPDFFQAVAPFLPLTPAFDGVTAIATGAPGLGAAWAGLFGWFVIGTGAAIIAVARKRTLTAGQASRLVPA